MPVRFFVFAEWAGTTYIAGWLLTCIGHVRKLQWLMTVGRVVAFIGGVVLHGLLSVAAANVGRAI